MSEDQPAMIWACLCCDGEWESMADPASDVENHCGDNSAVIQFRPTERGRRFLAKARKVYRDGLDRGQIL